MGTLRSNDATATRTSLKKSICVLLVFMAISPTHFLCPLEAISPKAEFQGTIFKLRERNKISSLLVYVLFSFLSFHFIFLLTGPTRLAIVILLASLLIVINIFIK